MHRGNCEIPRCRYIGLTLDRSRTKKKRGFRMFSSPVCATGLESSTAGIYRKSVDSFATLPRPVDIDTRRRPLITIDKQTVRLHRQWTRCSDLHTMRGLQKLDRPREIIVAGLLKTDLRCIRYCRSTFAYNQPQKSCKEQCIAHA